MAYLPNSKWGDCTQCPATNVACVKVAKSLVCTNCHQRNKAEEQQKKANQRTAARNTGFKLRNGLAESKGTQQYEDASVQALKNDLDYVHSRIVRMTAANAKTGLAECFVCGRKQHWTLCQLSHFVPRANTLTRWDFKANRCSCKYCNENLGGNLIIFAKKLNEEESGLAERLSELSREPYKWGRDELKQLLIDLRAKLRLVETKFNPQK